MGGTNDNNEGLVPGKPVAQPGITPLFVAPTPAELNRSLPQFEILSLIGQGGMGAVYKARQPRLDRFVAIKLLPPLLDGDVHSFGERFEREARAMAQLNDALPVPIFHVVLELSFQCPARRVLNKTTRKGMEAWQTEQL